MYSLQLRTKAVKFFEQGFTTEQIYNRLENKTINTRAHSCIAAEVADKLNDYRKKYQAHVKEIENLKNE